MCGETGRKEALRLFHAFRGVNTAERTNRPPQRLNPNFGRSRRDEEKGGERASSSKGQGPRANTLHGYCGTVRCIRKI